jgi:hypothetical protein
MICFVCSDYGLHVSCHVIGVDGNTWTLYPHSKSSKPLFRYDFRCSAVAHRTGLWQSSSLQQITRLRNS